VSAPYCDNPDCPRYREPMNHWNGRGCSFCGCYLSPEQIAHYFPTRQSRILSPASDALCAVCAEADPTPIPATWLVRLVPSDFDGLNMGPDIECDLTLCAQCTAHVLGTVDACITCGGPITASRVRRGLRTCNDDGCGRDD
jgi:hypothetical protein